jgi:threonine dehydrogenase-like Zn-dependent dehydrogenase
VPRPTLLHETDAIVRVVASGVCGSDLWRYRGLTPIAGPRRIGHEFIGTVEATGGSVENVRVGDFVVAPFKYSDGTCAYCVRGVTCSCVRGGSWGHPAADGTRVDGAQGEYVRVPLADGTLVATETAPRDDQLPELLALCDVLPTGHHAAVSAGVRSGSTVVVVGDGAIGLCAVLAARRLGAERVAIMSRHPERQVLAAAVGADEIIATRGEEGAAHARELFDGIGADCVLECVGTAESMTQAIGACRDGGRIGYVGAPHGVEWDVQRLFVANIGIAGGVTPARAYLPELLDDVWAGSLRPGVVFDRQLPLAAAPDAYRLMDSRSVVKTMLVAA